jgi:RNA polymerase sigma-70 factor (ECF subfamily)
MRAEDDDGGLLAAARGDIGSFEKVYRRYVGRVTAYAATRCASAADVGDVVAQTFVRLLRVADRYDPDRGEPGAFVFAVAANVVRDHHRSTRRQRQLVHRLAGRDLLDDADEIELVDAAIDAARAAPAAERALDTVSVSEEEILRMIADGASPSEAAVVLGISPVAARGRLFRARRRVKAQLTGTSTTPGTTPEEPRR